MNVTRTSFLSLTAAALTLSATSASADEPQRWYGTASIGVGSLWIVVPVGFTAGLLCWVVARPLRRLAEVREVYTVPDALYCRFGSRAVSGLAAVAIVLRT